MYRLVYAGYVQHRYFSLNLNGNNLYMPFCWECYSSFLDNRYYLPPSLKVSHFFFSNVTKDTVIFFRIFLFSNQDLQFSITLTRLLWGNTSFLMFLRSDFFFSDHETIRESWQKMMLFQWTCFPMIQSRTKYPDLL